MTKKKTKYLIETSGVPVALGESTPAHCDHFRDAVSDGSCWTSVYIRKEFIHRWIRDYMRMAFTVEHFQNVVEALYYLEQEFGNRAVKTYLHGLAERLLQKGRIENTRSMAKEFARLAVASLRKFDHRFRSRPPNSCGCRIGGKELKVDFNHLFESLREFLGSVDTVDDCPVNSFLGLDGSGHGARLLANQDVRENTKAGKSLVKLQAAGKWITCRECSTIGDAVIVLDQPPSWCLVHIDRDFEVLCMAAGRKRKPILSQRAIERGAPDRG